MKKGWISILSGFIFGLVISFTTLRYDGWKIIKHDKNAAAFQGIKELEFYLITNSFFIMMVSGIGIYLILSTFENRNHQYD